MPQINRILYVEARSLFCFFVFFFSRRNSFNFQVVKWNCVDDSNQWKSMEYMHIFVTMAQQNVQTALTKNWWWFFNVWHAIAIEETIGANELRSHHSQIHLPVNQTTIEKHQVSYSIMSVLDCRWTFPSFFHHHFQLAYYFVIIRARKWS